MRLCTICDKKIAGTWCKNCHRFVKTYELAAGIHLNESHDPGNDKNCTYHTNPAAKASNSSGSTTHTTYQKTQTSTQRNTVSTGGTVKSPKAGKLVLVIVILSIISTVIGVVAPIISQISDSVREEISNLAPAESEWDSSYSEDEPELNDVWEKELAIVNNKLAAMETLEPTEVVEEATYTISYYDAEEIKQLGIPCSVSHFAMDLEEYESWLKKNWRTDYHQEDYSSPYYNYYYESEYYKELCFSDYRDYYGEEDFAIRAEYDTATEELHGIWLMSSVENDCSDLTEMAFKTLQKLEPDTDWDVNDMREMVESGIKSEEYDTVYVSERLQISSMVSEDIIELMFYPANEYY